MNIRKPKFKLYQDITIEWEEEETKAMIVRRWLDLDDNENNGYWWYELSGMKNKNNTSGLYPEEIIQS